MDGTSRSGNSVVGHGDVGKSNSPHLESCRSNCSARFSKRDVDFVREGSDCPRSDSTASWGGGSRSKIRFRYNSSNNVFGVSVQSEVGERKGNNEVRTASNSGRHGLTCKSSSIETDIESKSAHNSGLSASSSNRSESEEAVVTRWVSKGGCERSSSSHVHSSDIGGGVNVVGGTVESESS